MVPKYMAVNEHDDELTRTHRCIEIPRSETQGSEIKRFELGVIISKAVAGDSKSEAKMWLQEGFRPANEARVWGRRAESWGSRAQGQQSREVV